MFVYLFNNKWDVAVDLFQGCESPEDYALCVWDHFIENSKAKYIAVVAHSYGALVTARLVGSS